MVNDDVFMQDLLTRLDNLSSGQSKNHTETCQRLASLETALKGIPKRVTNLERRSWYFAGVGGAITAALSYLGFHK